MLGGWGHKRESGPVFGGEKDFCWNFRKLAQRVFCSKFWLQILSHKNREDRSLV